MGNTMVVQVHGEPVRGDAPERVETKSMKMVREFVEEIRLVTNGVWEEFWKEQALADHEFWKKWEEGAP